MASKTLILYGLIAAVVIAIFITIKVLLVKVENRDETISDMKIEARSKESSLNSYKLEKKLEVDIEKAKGEKDEEISSEPGIYTIAF